MVGGGFAGLALSLVCGWVGGGFVGGGDDCWRRLAVGGDGGHGSGGIACVVARLVGLNGLADLVRGLEDALRVKPVVRNLLEEWKQQPSGECKQRARGGAARRRNI